MLESDKDAPATGTSLRGIATTAEITTALESLSQAALLRIRSYARYRIRALGPSALGRTHEDLMGEAFTATLAGTRRWNKDAVDFVGHLCGVMRSISSHWAELRATQGELSGVSWREDDADRPAVGERTASETPDAERELIARQRLARIVKHFEGDELVLAIMDAFQNGMKGPEAQLALGIDKTAFETAVKRLRRGVARLERDEEEA